MSALVKTLSRVNTSMTSKTRRLQKSAKTVNSS